jgi:predicted dehydrogenase
MVVDLRHMTKLRVGVMGLGRRWHKRYRLALRTMRDRFGVRAVYDAVQKQALREARRLGCTAAAGVIDLLERKDIDAVLLLDAAWHGLWPLEAAIGFGKPVFCAVPLEADPGHAEAVCLKVANAQLPVMPALPYRLAPASVWLKQLLRDQLGASRLLLCEQRGPKPGRIRAALLDWCAFLFEASPATARILISEAGSPIEELWADFGSGRAARISRWSAPHLRPQVRLHVDAARGCAVADMPRRVRWTDASGFHSYRAPDSKPNAGIMLERFHQAVVSGQPLQPSLEDVRSAWELLRAARTHTASDAS